MLPRNCILFLMFFNCAAYYSVAQENISGNEMPEVYQKIETYSAQRKFANMVHGWIVKPYCDSATAAVSKPVSEPETSFRNFEGKIIRQINIVTLDPFGYSVKDTSRKPHDFVSKSGNALHVKTQHHIIRNRLLIHKNDRFDSLLVKESERLIRSQSYIHDVSVQTIPVAENSDSVDVFIRVSDLWSIIPDGALSNSQVTLELVDKNLGGLGHTFWNRYNQNYLNGENTYAAYYYIPNFKNSYISARVSYAVDENRNYYKGLNVERAFFSPLARWAGGVLISQQQKPDWIYKNDTSRLYLTSKFNIQDYWGAAAWQIFKGNTVNNRTTKLILSGRIFDIRYLEKPVEQPELYDYFTNERFFMLGLGISSRKYVQQNYIFRFGTAEDVPVGNAYSIVGGYQLKNQERWYWGLRHSWGTFFKWGYFGTHFEYGTFLNASVPTQGVITAGMSYFSGLFSIGNWKFRQFVRPELTYGINRSPYDRLTLNDGYGLNGFNSEVLSGTSRLLLVVQTQSYAPWNLIGFRFGPYLNFSLGMLGDEVSGFSHSRVYPQIGMGLLIRNDYLVIRYFQLSFAFYPTIPGKGNDILKGNPFRTTDFGFRDFIVGKPEIVLYK